MPLPEAVINRLSEDHPAVSGNSSGLLLFAFTLLAITVVMYLGIVFGYEPYLNNKIGSLNAQIGKVSQSVSSDQAASFITFYSQIVHTKSLLQSHVHFSQLLAWLERDTQANTYYQSFSFSGNNQVTLSVLAKSQADMSQQIAIFESDPNIRSVNVSNVSIGNVSGFWQSNITLTVDPAIFMSSGT